MYIIIGKLTYCYIMKKKRKKEKKTLTTILCSMLHVIELDKMTINAI